MTNLDTPRRWDSWAQWAVVIVLLLTALWNVSGQLSRITQKLDDMVVNQDDFKQRLERLENRYPFPAPTKVQ